MLLFYSVPPIHVSFGHPLFLQPADVCVSAFFTYIEVSSQYVSNPCSSVQVMLSAFTGDNLVHLEIVLGPI